MKKLNAKKIPAKLKAEVKKTPNEAFFDWVTGGKLFYFTGNGGKRWWNGKTVTLRGFYGYGYAPNEEDLRPYV